MKKHRWFFPLLAAAAVLVSSPAMAQPTAADRIPDTLKPWENWATWNDEALRQSPTLYAEAKTPLTFWPSELRLSAAPAGATFRQTVTVYSPTWVALPGSELLWPSGVTVGGKPAAVLGQDGRPVVRLAAGTQEISGRLEWKAMPQNIPLPPATGIVLLDVEGQPVEAPLWDEEGRLWLKRGASPEEAAGPDFLSANLYAALEDGIPLWLKMRVELIVSGQSREEDLGTILPQGWSVSSVDSPLPVAVDESGRAKAQVRAGRWTINVSAFRLDDARELRFADNAKPAADSVLIGFQAKPDFRIVELGGVAPVDVTMTTFPDDWRNLPVYQWPVGDALQIEERLRGMGEQAPEGLRIARAIWLDENGRGMTFRDNLSGTRQKIWRLDAADGQELGSVRSDGVGQLITRDPADGAPGVEIRSRNLSLEAAGRMAVSPAMSATGWKTDADNLEVTLNLPPGWRLFALFGADWVQGDWLTSWSLLDIFIVMIFTLAVFRLRGAGAALLAFVALALSYRESGAPQMLWLALLAPIAIMTVVPSGRLRTLVGAWKWVTVAIFLLSVVPFISAQIQQAIYPQLERVPGVFFTPRPVAAGRMFEAEAVAAPSAAPMEASDSYGLLRSKSANVAEQQVRSQNMAYEAKARIQTGPGVPEWSWRGVRFGWNGPVTAGQTFRPVLISLGLERVLTLLRIGVVLALLAVLIGLRRVPLPSGPAAALLLLSFLLFAPATASAQFPDAGMLKTLRERLIEKNDLPAQTAAIPRVTLTLTDRRIIMESEIHAATFAAVPLPGMLPAWSPVAVTVDGKPGAAVRRDGNYLWVALPAGVHTVRVEGLLGDASQWEWTFQLKPHRVLVEAPGWNVSGINPDGVPEQQVFFSRQQKAVSEEAAYDRQDFQTVALVERELELGLIWQVRTTVRRLTAPGKAMALRVPLLPGEKVLSANIPIKDGAAEVRLPAGEEAVSWQSELTASDKLALATRPNDTWVEQWRLIASPVWNVTFGGTAPVFEEGAGELIPVWRPWPGESAELVIGRPEPVPGATVTVHRAKHAMELGDRQRTSTLELALTSSLGEDFLVALPTDAQITSLSLDGTDLPARMDGDRVVVPLRPGEQKLNIGWRTSVPLTSRAQVDTVTLPVESANIETTVGVPANRWVLWTDGPQRGPAVRFWTVLAFSLVAALFLGRLKGSPLRTVEWMLLAIGLTQVPLPAALVVVGWLFLLVWRGHPRFQDLAPVWFNLSQALVILATLGALGVLISAVAAGLLGSPEMFIAGNGSTAGSLAWYIDRAAAQLPSPSVQSVSVWWYRLAMLVWAIWLATATLRWLVRGWNAFTNGGAFRSMGKKATPPAVPPAQS